MLEIYLSATFPLLKRKKVGAFVGLVMRCQAQALFCDEDDMAAVEVADGTLKCFLAHAKDVADELRVRLVTIGAETVVGDEIVGERVGKVSCLLSPGGLQHHIDFAVLPHLVDISPKPVAGMDFAEYLVVVNQSLVGVVDNDLETHICFLPHQQVDCLIVIVVCGLLAQVSFHLGGSNNAVALFIDVDMNDMVTVVLHLFLLFAKGAEKVLHQSPVEEGTVLVDPRHSKVTEFAHFYQWSFGGGNEAFVLVEIDEDFNFFSDG